MYVWLGRKTNSAQRQVIQKLAAEKFDEGYHKLALHQSHQMHAKTRAINTLTNETGPHLSRRASGAARRGSAKARRGVPEQKAQKEKEPRPPHAILCQLFEGSEWVVFKEKFCDWPDESRIIRMKGGPESVGEITKVCSFVYLYFFIKMILSIDNVDFLFHSTSFPSSNIYRSSPIYIFDYSTIYVNRIIIFILEN